MGHKLKMDTTKQDRQKQKREPSINEMDGLDVGRLMEMPEFRRFVWRYLGLTKIYETSFTGNSETFFNEGMRAVGLTLIRDVADNAPKQYLQMISDNQTKGKR